MLLRNFIEAKTLLNWLQSRASSFRFARLWQSWIAKVIVVLCMELILQITASVTIVTNGRLKVPGKHEMVKIGILVLVWLPQ